MNLKLHYLLPFVHYIEVMKPKFLPYFPYLAGLVLVLGLIWIGVSRVNPELFEQQGIQAPQEGLLAPDFTLTDLSGETVSLQDFRGRPVMVNFWASWCPPCRSEMPAMEAMYQEFRAADLEILAVNATYQDRITDAEAFVEENQLTFPVLLDRTGEVNQAYQVHSLPTTFFIDSRGVIQKIVIGGPMQEALIFRHVENLLED
jgi:peroxiredoxin